MSGDKILIYCVRDGRIEHFQQRDLFLPSFDAVMIVYYLGGWNIIDSGEQRGER